MSEKRFSGKELVEIFKKEVSNEEFRKILKTLHNHGFHIIPAIGKKTYIRLKEKEYFERGVDTALSISLINHAYEEGWLAGLACINGLKNNKYDGYDFTIDIDDVELSEKAKEHPITKKTFSVLTGSGKLHIHFLSPFEFPTLQIEENGKRIEIRGIKTITIMPPTIHEKTGKKYKILSDEKPMLINDVFLKDFLSYLGFSNEKIEQIFQTLKTSLEIHKRQKELSMKMETEEKRGADEKKVLKALIYPNILSKRKNIPLFPPCLLYVYKNGIEEGNRNNTGFALSTWMGTFEKMGFDAIFLCLKEWNERNRPPLPEREIISLAKQGEKYRFSFRLLRERLSFLTDKEYCEKCLYRSICKKETEIEETVSSMEKIKEEIIPLKREKEQKILESMGSNGLRKGQIIALEQILKSKKKFIVLMPPTGWGKTFFITFLLKLKGKPSIIVVPNKQLQEEIAKFGVEFLKGKRNYECLSPYPYLCECYRSLVKIYENDKEKIRELKEISRDICSFCPYRKQKEKIKNILENNGVVCLNTGNFKFFTHLAEIIVFDEFHEILRMYSEGISLKKKAETHEEIRNLFAEEMKELEKELEMVEDEIAKISLSQISRSEKEKKIKELLKEKNRIEDRINKIEFYLENIEDLYVIKRGEKYKVKMRERGIMKNFIKYNKNKEQVFFVSATPIIPEEFEEQFEIVEGKLKLSTKNAPIFFAPIRKYTKTSILMDYKNGYTREDVYKPAVHIFEFWDEYLQSKKSIFFVGDTKERLNGIKLFLHKYCEKKGKKLFVHEKGKLDKTFKEFKEYKGEAILLMSSGQVGLDFAGDEYRLLFILNNPYPEKTELEGLKKTFGKDIAVKEYAEMTIKNLVQLCGRVNRGSDDLGVVVIVDEKFAELFNKYFDMFPDIFKERIIDLSEKLKVNYSTPSHCKK